MIKQLPRELWVYIIQSINSVSQLAECRLVCKDLNAICEPTIFTKEIVIKSEEAAVKFYGYLSKNPKNGTSIKRLKFDHQIESMALMKELLRIVFNPAMESLDGVIDANEFYLCINSISDNSPVPFTNLKRVPHPTSSSSAPYVNTLLKFRSSLEAMHLNVNEPQVYPVLYRLSEFHCLTDITFEGIFQTIHELETHLLQCPQLQHLTLNGYWYNKAVLYSGNDIWRAEEVVKANALRKLTITEYCAIEMLEYLLFKYADVETVELFLNIPAASGLHGYNDIERAMNALKQASLQQIFLKLDIEAGEFLNVLQYLVTNRVNYTITDLIDGLVDIRINQL